MAVPPRPARPQNPPSPISRRARRLAEQEASLAGQTLVGPEHLLVALASPEIAEGPTALGTFGLNSSQLRIAVHELSNLAMSRPLGRLGFSVLAERALYNATVFADREQSPTRHRHLLAGVLSVDSRNVSRVLAKLGTTVPAVQQVLGIREIGPADAVTPQPGRAAMVDPLESRVADLAVRVDQLTTLVEQLLVSRHSPS